MKRKINFLLILACLFLGISCEKDQNAPENNAYKVNKFIKEAMNDIYLWYKEMPDLNPESEIDPKTFYKKLLYTEDKWSYITDDATTLNNSFSGIETTFGYQLAFYKTGSNSNEYIAVVEYVNSNTPAAVAGIQRGDYFVRINNERINSENYLQLIYGSSIILTKAKLEGRNIVESDETVSLESKILTINPVLFSRIIEQNGTKIGYLVYTSYVGDLNHMLENALAEFKAANVTEVVLDLRFNGGGDEVASTYLCSSLAPKAEMDKKSILIYNKWNDKYDAYWRQNNYTSRVERRFESVPSNLDLKRLFVLTSKNTASASELTIIGLMPYINVIKIGDTTYGKYTSMVLLQPEDKAISNWALLPIVAKYTNANGFTDFKDGLAPDYEVEDNLFPAVALGDVQEPLLAKALELIGGNVQNAPSKAKISGSALPDFEFVDARKSRFDALHNNDIIMKLVEK